MVRLIDGVGQLLHQCSFGFGTNSRRSFNKKDWHMRISFVPTIPRAYKMQSKLLLLHRPNLYMQVIYPRRANMDNLRVNVAKAGDFTFA